MKRLNDKAAVVTGAAQGIGRAIAVRLAEEGARVAALDLNEPAETLAACRAAGTDSLALAVDVSARDSIGAAVATITGRWGGIDILVNNAGIFDDTPLTELAEARWDRVIGVNYKGMFLSSQLAAPFMRERRWGRIINISSMAAKVAFANETAYCSSKSAVLGLTRALAVELGRHGITANAICPGPIKTELLKNTYQHLADQNGVTLAAWEAKMLEGIPVGRFGQPSDVSALVAFLASEEAAFINGQSINIDGGMVFY